MDINRITSQAGALNQVTNNGGFTVIYEIEFEGAGRVTFTVQPGATFSFTSLGASVNIHIKEVLTGSIRPAAN